MPKTPAEIIRAILNNPTDLESVKQYIAPNATYVSLNYENADLKKLMPWAGTSHEGADAVVSTYKRVGRYWKNEGFAIEDVIESADKVAVFGRFTYRSVTLGKVVTSPFSILARVENERVVYMQFMEDTFATAATFRSGGEAVFHADPDGGEVMV